MLNELAVEDNLVVNSSENATTAGSGNSFAETESCSHCLDPLRCFHAHFNSGMSSPFVIDFFLYLKYIPERLLVLHLLISPPTPVFGWPRGPACSVERLWHLVVLNPCSPNYCRNYCRISISGTVP